MCSQLNCNSEKYIYAVNNLKCPPDSIKVKATQQENACCGIQHSCACATCSDEKEMNEWCKLAGTSFDAALIENGQAIPGKCCDIHICRKKYLIS